MEMTKAPKAADPGAVDHVLVWAHTGLWRHRCVGRLGGAPRQQVMFAPVAR
jgi:hypothetical protein